jgi:hypothetical protein
MVIIAPIIAPTEKMIESVSPRMRMKRRERLRLLRVEHALALHLEGEPRIVLQSP